MLNWQKLTTPLCEMTHNPNQSIPHPHLFSLQHRLCDTVRQFCVTTKLCPPHRLLLLNATDDLFCLQQLKKLVEHYSQSKHDDISICGYKYRFNRQLVVLEETQNKYESFTTHNSCQIANWIEHEQLFGSLRYEENSAKYHLQPGLIHQVNDGILILSLNTLLMQPLLWQRLKNCVMSGFHHWVNKDENSMLPVSIPPIPLEFRLILVGDHLALSDFQAIEPYLFQHAFYSEFDAFFTIDDEQLLAEWLNHLKSIQRHFNLPNLAPDALKTLLKIASRLAEDQYKLPLEWSFISQLWSTAAITQPKQITADHLQNTYEQFLWQQDAIKQHSMQNILDNYIHIDTTGHQIGQVNGLSVVEYPGHPFIFGEPCRISCVLQSGTGEFNDVENRSELAGHIHSKGMMIISAFVASELALEHPLPFNVNLVFEQSYTEIDGDSASLAGLCAYMSALSLLPLTQQIAVTGAIDQFGRVQAVGGINEKIESFFTLCQERGLTGQQGVIIPATNQRQLNLSEPLIDAVRLGVFHLYAIEHASQALTQLTGIAYNQGKLSILSLIEERIQKNLVTDKKIGLKRWFNWLPKKR